MKLSITLVVLGATLAGAGSGPCLFAQDTAHPNFTGTWYLDTAKSEIRSKLQATAWAIRQNDDSIAIDQQIKGKTESLKCGTNGLNCKGKPDGESGEVTFYYNGAMLVETDFLGHDKDRVVKKRLKLAEDGKTMEIEVMHVNPQGPTEKWVFQKQTEAKK
jgi:hypothetical protein